MRGAELVSRDVGMPRGISSREEALNSGRARTLLVGRVGGGVKLLGLPVRGRRARKMMGAGTDEEAMAEVTDATKVVNGEGEGYRYGVLLYVDRTGMYQEAPGK